MAFRWWGNGRGLSRRPTRKHPSHSRAERRPAVSAVAQQGKLLGSGWDPHGLAAAELNGEYTEADKAAFQSATAGPA
ncbi:hypothetical protein [Actinoplanes sp. NPDC026670]|uniref:hypothetical protein n=1 Tax=Actinoplanes sp. NPDC026670 TaxID=3154700 RepID=UPI0033F940CE